MYSLKAYVQERYISFHSTVAVLPRSFCVLILCVLIILEYFCLFVICALRAESFYFPSVKKAVVFKLVFAAVAN